MVDDGDSLDQRIGTVSDGHPVPAVLQRANGLWQGRVLATLDDILILWAVLVRPPLPRLLPPALRTSPRRVVWPIAGAFLLASRLRNGLPLGPFALCLDAVPRPPPVFDAGIHLVPTQPRDSAQLPRPSRFHGAVPAVGAYGVQSRHARNSPQG